MTQINNVVDVCAPVAELKQVNDVVKPKKVQTMTKKTKNMIILCGEMYNFDGEEAIQRLLNYEKPKKEKKVKEPRKRKTASSSEEDGEKKKRGRPAKTIKVMEESHVDDMFADMVENAEDAVEEEKVKPTEKKAPKSKGLSKEEKEAVKAKAKAEKEAEKAKAKAEKEAEKAEKARQAKLNKEAEKLAKAKKVKEPKKSKKAQKIAKKAEMVTTVTDTDSEKELQEEPEEEQEQKPEEEVFKVKKFVFNGVTYLRTRSGDNWHENGHIYNMEQNLVGFWNEKEQDIKFVEEGECVEEEYDE